MYDVARPGAPGFLFGCDPELFVVNGEGNLVSAFGLIEGTKDKPFKVEKGAYQVDGLAAEFNIDPVDNFDDFNLNIVTVLDQLKAALPQGHKLVAKSAVKFPQEVIDAMPPEALALGCDPDFNAWRDGAENPAPEVPEGTNLRTASGHIHVGWGKNIDVNHPDHIRHCCDLVKQFDWFIGAPSIQYEDGADRRLLYGRAGAMRIKDYGVEYRVPSNFWVLDIRRRRWIWNRIQVAIAEMRTRFYPDAVTSYNNTEVTGAINNTDMDYISMSTRRRYQHPLRDLIAA